MNMSTLTGFRLSQAQRYWELLYVLAEREIKVRYRGSFLGVYWSLFNPLIMTSVYSVIFGKAFIEDPKYFEYYHGSILEYILRTFTGLVVIHFFQGATSQALTSVVNNASLLNKIKLPPTVFPISTILANTFQLVVGMFPLLAILTIATNPHSWMSLINVAAIVLPLTALVLVSAGVGLLVSSLYVFFRDLPFFYELIQFILLLCSPIFYPDTIIRDRWLRELVKINPLYPIIKSLPQIVISGNLPDLGLISSALLSGVIILGVGFFCFNWLRPKFMDLL
jgi:lipopolysaccharide transport system permease protein